jgi:hypothetical protein
MDKLRSTTSPTPDMPERDPNKMRKQLRTLLPIGSIDWLQLRSLRLPSTISNKEGGALASYFNDSLPYDLIQLHVGAACTLPLQSNTPLL